MFSKFLDKIRKYSPDADISIVEKAYMVCL